MCSCFHSLCAQFVRAEGHTALYAVQGMINTVLVIGLNVLFLVGLRMGITGYVLSVALADLACTLLLFVRERLWRQLMLCPGWAAAREMLAYSIPMIPTTVFWWITSVSDRYMVTAYLGVDANGIYAVSYKMPTILSLVSSIFMEAWQFSAVSEAQGSRREHIRFFSKVWCSFQSVMFLAGACIIAFAVPEIHVLTTEQYYGAWLYVPVLGMAMVFSAFVSYLGSVYMVEKCSKRTFVTSMIGALLNIALNFLLIPSKLGVQGAAIATCVSYFVVFVIRAVDARKFIPFRFYVVGVTGKLHPADGADALHRPAASGLEDRAGSVHFAAAPAQPQAASGRRGQDRPLPPLTQHFWRICDLKIWNSLFGKIILTFLISMVPVLELRGAIPIGVAHGLDYRAAIAVSIVGNLVPVPFIVLFIRKIFAWLRTKSERLNAFVTRMEQRALKKSEHRAPCALLGPVPLCGHSAAGHRRVDGLAHRRHAGDARQGGLSADRARRRHGRHHRRRRDVWRGVAAVLIASKIEQHPLSDRTAGVVFCVCYSANAFSSASSSSRSSCGSLSPNCSKYSRMPAQFSRQLFASSVSSSLSVSTVTPLPSRSMSSGFGS